MMDKTIWLWTAKGGQLGLHLNNIKRLIGVAVWDRSGTKYDLDHKRWDENFKALVEGLRS